MLQINNRVSSLAKTGVCTQPYSSFLLCREFQFREVSMASPATDTKANTQTAGKFLFFYALILLPTWVDRSPARSNFYWRV